MNVLMKWAAYSRERERASPSLSLFPSSSSKKQLLQNVLELSLLYFFFFPQERSSFPSLLKFCRSTIVTIASCLFIYLLHENCFSARLCWAGPVLEADWKRVLDEGFFFSHNLEKKGYGLSQPIRMFKNDTCNNVQTCHVLSSYAQINSPGH